MDELVRVKRPGTVDDSVAVATPRLLAARGRAVERVRVPPLLVLDQVAPLPVELQGALHRVEVPLERVQQRLQELALEAVGHYGAPFLRDMAKSNLPIGPDYAEGAAGEMFNGRKTSIYGGSNEIQRNIIAKMVLGL